MADRLSVTSGLRDAGLDGVCKLVLVGGFGRKSRSIIVQLESAQRQSPHIPCAIILDRSPDEW